MSTHHGLLPSRRLITSVVLASAAALVLAGCSAPQSIAAETVRGLPAGVTLADDEQMGEQPVALWTDNRVTLTVVTWGSSSCPPIPTSLEVESAALMMLTFAPPAGEVCTADFAPTSHVFTTPDGISFGAMQLEITFEGRGGDESTTVTVPIRDNG
ncbi:MAG: hypothetical protein KIT89_04735 [Microcella sp.]|uniref:hypothetical protein n=1 Tax=Microcella sp. TaxID=1913979 RepID=UPI0024CC87C9|nr:hypothetical protein [Microcella sp.]UYN84498.1 MAG: hypothetical protein KIT89_04735 [Microcella sp.]